MAKPVFPSGLSLHKRLPLLICILLLSTVIIFSYTSYLEVKKVSVSAATERLHTLTAQISTMFEEGGTAMTTAIQKTAGQACVKAFLQSNGRDSDKAVRQLFLKEQMDTLVPLVELFSANHQKLLGSGDNKTLIAKKDSVLPATIVNTPFTQVGHIYTDSTSIYSPIVTTVSDGKLVIGYLVKWRRLTITQATIDALSQLMGAKSAFYVGNDDGRFWTNGLRTFPSPPLNLKDPQQVISFQNAFGERVIGAAQQVPQTRWLVLITLSQPEVTRAAEQFLYRMAGIGVVLVVAGIFFAWLIGRSITQPLNKLTRAAEAIAKGNYDLQLRIRRRDELGKLANAFNTMTLTRKKYEEDLRFLGEQLRQLATHLQNVREEERIGIAREIHDVIGQQLTAIKFDVHWLSRKINGGEEAKNKFTDTMELIDDTIQATRKISSALRPDILNDLGLVEALRWQSNEFQNRTGILCQFISFLQNQKIDTAVSFGLYRIYQEALTNVSRHSEAAAIDARLECDSGEKHIILSIADNGKGFDPEAIKSKKRLGIVGMRERILSMNGTYVLESAPGKGTTITVTVPL